jgi:hypothetical protein
MCTSESREQPMIRVIPVSRQCGQSRGPLGAVGRASAVRGRCAAAKPHEAHRPPGASHGYVGEPTGSTLDLA